MMLYYIVYTYFGPLGTQKSNFLKILLMGAGPFHADGRTDIMKLTVAFCDFANVPNNNNNNNNKHVTILLESPVILKL